MSLCFPENTAEACTECNLDLFQSYWKKKKTKQNKTKQKPEINEERILNSCEDGDVEVKIKLSFSEGTDMTAEFYFYKVVVFKSHWEFKF